MDSKMCDEYLVDGLLAGLVYQQVTIAKRSLDIQSRQLANLLVG